jgi:hypothetical protein
LQNEQFFMFRNDVIINIPLVNWIYVKRSNVVDIYNKEAHSVSSMYINLNVTVAVFSQLSVRISPLSQLSIYTLM